jgi:hypothetical protein
MDRIAGMEGRLNFFHTLCNSDYTSDIKRNFSLARFFAFPVTRWLPSISDRRNLHTGSFD